MLSAITLAARLSASRRPRSAGEALLLAGNVVGDAREGLAGDHRLAGRDLGQRVGGVDAVVLDRPAAWW